MQQPLYLPDLNITSQIRNKTGVSGSCLAMHVFINYVFTCHTPAKNPILASTMALWMRML